MNSTLAEETTTPEVPDAPGQSPASVALYIDADNQSPQCAKALLGVLQADFDARVVSATIAGNNHGQQVDSWRNELLSELPGPEVHALTVPNRKQGADVALLMALGAELERHMEERMLVVIVSRDDLVIGAAEQAKARGCRTLVAYADGEIPTARNPHLTTLLLPALGRAPSEAPVGDSANPRPRSPAPAPVDPVAAVLAQLRAMCTPRPGGGYGASDVGQALAKLGYDKVARTRFLASAPGLTVRGAGSGKVLVF